MSKGSQQQQPTSPRERKLTPAPRSKQSNKADNNGSKPVPPRDATKPAAAAGASDGIGVVPSESEEDDFFARGDMSSYPPAAMDPVAEPELELEATDVRPPLTPAQLDRRARLRRIVGGVVGAAAVMTAVVGAKALSAPSAKVADAKGTLNVPQQVVPSIALAPEGTGAAAAKSELENAAAQEPAAPAAVAAVENPSAEGNSAQANPVQPNSAPENAAPAAAEEPKAEEPAKEATARRLPVIDVEVPQTTDPAIDQQWESAAKNLASKNFNGADSVFADLGKRGDAATREAARLARALWWTANGRESEVKPVIADLAANATTPSVRQQARERLRAN